MEPKTGKRIVSKGEYAVFIGRKATLSVSGSLFVATAWVIGFIDFSLTLYIMGLCALQWAGDPGTNTRLILILLCVCLGLVVPLRLLLRLGYHVMHKANIINPGIPLTRANTADLPAPESLVRASSEPLQTQEAVLLRAAAQGRETPADELVRASVGQERE